MKISELLKVWGLLQGGKFGKMAGDGKIKYVRILAKLSPVVKEFESFRETVIAKLKEEHEDFDGRLEKAREFEMWKNGQEGVRSAMSEQEHKDFVAEVLEYNKAVDAALKEEAAKDVCVEFDRLTGTEFGCFIDSNDFTGEEALALSDIMCDFE